MRARSNGRIELPFPLAFQPEDTNAILPLLQQDDSYEFRSLVGESYIRNEWLALSEMGGSNNKAQDSLTLGVVVLRPNPKKCNKRGGKVQCIYKRHIVVTSYAFLVAHHSLFC